MLYAVVAKFSLIQMHFYDTGANCLPTAEEVMDSIHGLITGKLLNQSTEGTSVH